MLGTAAPLQSNSCDILDLTHCFHPWENYTSLCLSNKSPSLLSPHSCILPPSTYIKSFSLVYEQWLGVGASFLYESETAARIPSFAARPKRKTMWVGSGSAIAEVAPRHSGTLHLCCGVQSWCIEQYSVLLIWFEFFNLWGKLCNKSSW